MTLRDQIQNYLRANKTDWIASGTLQRMEFKSREGRVVTPQVTGRMLRYMEEHKCIAVKYEGAKHHAFYKHIPEYIRKHYIPSTERKEKKIDAMFNVPMEQIKALINRYTPS